MLLFRTAHSQTVQNPITVKFNLFLILFITSISLFGQRTISGIVISEYMYSLSEVRIQNSDTLLLGKTDFDGNFEITLAKENNKLIFSWLGYEWLTVVVPKNCNYIEVILLEDGTYDFISLKKMNRIRFKRFEKLPELYKTAFNKGLFKNDKPCYALKFEPYE